MLKVFGVIPAVVGAYLAWMDCRAIWTGIASSRERPVYEATEPFLFWLAVSSQAVCAAVMILVAYLFLNSVSGPRKKK